MEEGTVFMSDYVENAALYLRLSREDSEMHQESNSIANQRILLKQHAQKIGVMICAEFVDDGESGTKWERTGLQEMLMAIKCGWIKTVLVKDLSRLSRDYIRTGELLEKFFPAYHVRFISVEDRIDSAQPTAVGEFAAIRAVMDDWYARDISRKVRAAIYSRQNAGYCTAASLPYGYYRANNEIFVHANHAKTVCEIFALFRNGLSCTQIAAHLNTAHEPSPRNLSTGWTDTAIRYILQNSAYTGSFRLHTTEKVNCKTAIRTRVSSDRHVIYQIPSIISSADYQEVQNIFQIRKRKTNEKHWLSGKAVCGICGSNMTVTADDRLRLICGGRRRKNGCRNPSLRLDILSAQITDALYAAGMSVTDGSLKRLINRMIITPEQVTVRLLCQKPSAQSSR